MPVPVASPESIPRHLRRSAVVSGGKARKALLNAQEAWWDFAHDIGLMRAAGVSEDVIETFCAQVPIAVPPPPPESE